MLSVEWDDLLVMTCMVLLGRERVWPAERELVARVVRGAVCWVLLRSSACRGLIHGGCVGVRSRLREIGMAAVGRFIHGAGWRRSWCCGGVDVGAE